MKIKYALITISLLSTILAIYFIVGFFNKEKISEKKVVVEEKVDEYENELEMVKLFAEQKQSPFGSLEGIAEFEKRLKEKYSTPESTIGYLVSLSMLKDVDSYSSVFISETYYKDIHERADPSKLTGKIDLINEAMDKLTRSGKLEKIEYHDVKWTTEKGSVRVIVDFHYSDMEKPVRVNILLRTKETYDLHTESHESPQDDMKEEAENSSYYVATSVWEIIKGIEKGAR